MIVGGHNGAGRPVLSWRWRLGPARFGSYFGGWFSIYRTSSMPASGFGCCDRCHGLLFEYPIFFGRPARPSIFWTTAEALQRSATSASKKQRLTWLCRNPRSWRLRRLVLEGWLVMTKLSRAVIACISATMMLPGVAPIARADTFTYNLNNSLKAQDGDPPLVSYGGTVGHTGYTFGVQQGLSLRGTGAFDVYSIDIQFYFDDINGSAAGNGYERILDFKNRALDTGLYNKNGFLIFFIAGNTYTLSPGPVFASGQIADLLLTRSATGLFSAYVNDNLALSFSDSAGLTTFSAPDNIIWFFMDDFQTLQNYPPEAGSGFVDRIRITTPRDPVAVPGPTAGAGLPGLILASGGLLGWW